MALSPSDINVSLDQDGCDQAARQRASLLGKFEEAILLAAIACGPEATAEDIRTCIETRIGDRPITAVLTTLDRLAEKGFIERGLETEPSKRKGGRKRRLFKVTNEGVRGAVHALSITADLARAAGLVKAA